MELLTGFLVGLLGSFHCIGMCGPIAIALDREPLGKALDIEGFIAPKSRRSSRLIVHITEYATSDRN